MPAGVYEMAYVNETPWHGLGKRLTPDASVDVWIKEAGLEWKVRERPIYARSDANEGGTFFHEHVEGYKVLQRADNGFTLGVVSNRYKVVQPRVAVEFYRTLVEKTGLTIETAGALRGGKRIWALANTHQDFDILGDNMKRYLLMATGYDGNFATVVQHTSVRVVCNNTLQMAVNAAGVNRVVVQHNAKFDAAVVRGLLGLNSACTAFRRDSEALARRKVDSRDAFDFFSQVYYGVDYNAVLDRQTQTNCNSQQRKVRVLCSSFENAPGQQTDAARGTAWGLVNAVTHYEDFRAGAKSSANRLNNAWFGTGRAIKQRAWENALALAA